MKRRRIWWRIVFWLLLVCVLAFMLRRFEHNQVFHPSLEMDASGADLGRPFEDVYFKAADGAELNGWFFPPNPGSARAPFVVLVCHGNAGNISTRLDVYEALLETGIAVFAFDYRGYGRSRGQLNEEGTYLDAQAAYRWLREKGFSEKHIISYGESLGGGIASELSRRETTAGLILQSTFTSIVDIGAELFPWLPVRWMSRIKYDTCNRLPKLHVPVLVMHSRTDGLIRFHHAEKNFAAANEPKLFCELQGEHNDPLGERAKFVEGIEQFLKLLEGATKTLTAGHQP